MVYITKMKLPPSLLGKCHYLFGNIKRIYCKTMKFYETLKACGNDPEAIAAKFINFVSGIIILVPILIT